MISRRLMLLGAASTPIAIKLAIVSANANSQTGHAGPASATQVVALQRVRVGDTLVTAVSDGYISFDVSLLSNIKPEAANKILATEFLKASPVNAAVNTFLVQSGARTTLIDTGARGYAPECGQISTGLAVAGVDLADVDTVLMTHLHADHTGGLVTDGRATFPNAELLIHKNDLNYYSSDANRLAAPEALRISFDKTKEALAAYGDRVKMFSGNIEIVPGIRTRELFGHTPGHSGFVIGSGEDALFMWGDIVHVGPVQMEHPEVGVVFDTDGAMAVATRKAILEEVASNGTRIAGAHIAFPGIGHVRRSTMGEGYHFEPEAWSYTL